MHQLVLTLLAVLSSGLFVADCDLASDRARKTPDHFRTRALIKRCNMETGDGGVLGKRRRR